MKLIKTINKCIGYGCVVMTAVCFGYAVSSGQNHVFFTTLLYALLAWGIFTGERKDKEDER